MVLNGILPNDYLARFIGLSPMFFNSDKRVLKFIRSYSWREIYIRRKKIIIIYLYYRRRHKSHRSAARHQAPSWIGASSVHEIFRVIYRAWDIKARDLNTYLYIHIRILKNKKKFIFCGNMERNSKWKPDPGRSLTWWGSADITPDALAIGKRISETYHTRCQINIYYFLKKIYS